MFKIGIDASGGDNGETEVIKAIIESIKNIDNLHIVIYGVEDKIKNEFSKFNFDYNISNLSIVNSPQVIEMNDHPVLALRTKIESSIAKAGKDLVNKNIDAFISAGSTGALISLAQFYLKPIEGIDRPVLAAILPTSKRPMLLVDSGCNVDSKPEWLYQYAILANTYYKLMFDEDRPSIGLLSVGTEENKGNNLTLATYKLLQNDSRLNFIGNVEARDLTRGICDILVTDGFAGNVFLKTYEGTAKLLLELIKEQIKSSFVSQIGGLLIKPALKKLLYKYDAKIYGGAPILGANGLIIKCHGNSMQGEYKYAINQAIKLLDRNLINIINQNLMR